VRSGHRVLLLQGFLAPPRVWSAVVAQLSERLSCITVDWPFGAHQRAARADADLSPPGIARVATEVLDALGVERAVLVGNDSGGVIAQLVVATEPHRVEGLVLVACDAFEVFPPGVYRHLFRLARMPGLPRLMAAALNSPTIARSRFGFGAVTYHPAVLQPPHRLLADPLIRRDLAKLMAGSSSSQTLAAARSFAHFDRPVLVVWAQQDRLFERSLGRRLADAFPRGRLVTVPASRTFVPLDQPAVLAALISELAADLT
jgi:pimeloyl-ACP methyl ester carboxylesterase